MTVTLISAAIAIVGLAAAGLVRIAILAEQDALEREKFRAHADDHSDQDLPDVFIEFEAKAGFPPRERDRPHGGVDIATTWDDYDLDIDFLAGRSAFTEGRAYDLIKVPNGMYYVRPTRAHDSGAVVLPHQFLDAIRSAAEGVEPWARRADTHADLQDQLLEAVLDENGNLKFVRPSEAPHEV